MNNENKNDEFVFLTPMDVAKIIGCSVPTARKLFYRDDFPAIKQAKISKCLSQNLSNGAVKGECKLIFKLLSFIIKLSCYLFETEDIY